MRLFIFTLILLCHFSILAQNPTVRLEMSSASYAAQISTTILFFNGARIHSEFFKTLAIDGVAESYYFPNSKPETSNLSDYKLK